MFCWVRYLFIALVTTLGILSMLGACGQKGPLYLPEDAPAQNGGKESDVPAAPAAPSTSGPQPDQL
ncbi:LPS translocon maturation chaperone LptM [Thiorhodococcus fuscus]|uniref:Lipoprotein n=1 Tax=Thiorhodococcus fuscus TaxID=527200 RepID=A0ABW4Y864_9GAMM